MLAGHVPRKAWGRTLQLLGTPGSLGFQMCLQPDSISMLSSPLCPCVLPLYEDISHWGEGPP